MAAKQPDAKNIDLFKKGTSRSLLLAEFGLHIASELREDGKKYEIFKFTNGYSKTAKAGRALLHGMADIATLGLWEIVGTPTEGTFSGDKVAFEVRYDHNNLVERAVLLTE